MALLEQPDVATYIAKHITLYLAVFITITANQPLLIEMQRRYHHAFAAAAELATLNAS